MEQNLNTEFEAAVQFLYSFLDYELNPIGKYDDRNYNLDRLCSFLTILGNPQESGWHVHIAGTNGKGSVAAMIADALTRAGLKTGLYTSPHLITFRERIRINGCMVTPDEIVAGVDRIKNTSMRFDGLTFFDVWTALAFDHFARSAVDTSVIEVGMGGRLDSTNVINPAVSIITSIGIDHSDKLGKTSSEIAHEKAGIIKLGVPVVSAPQEPAVQSILEKEAKKAGTRLIVVGRDVRWEKEKNGMSYYGSKWTFDDVSVPLEGSMQFMNAAVAMAALEVLASEGYPVDPVNARKGIETVRWPGRLETVSTNPDIILDGACNPAAMRMVYEFLSTRSPRDKTVAVVAMCRDKEVSEVLDILGNAASRFVVTQVENPRALSARELAERSPDTVQIIVEPDPLQAVEKAISRAGRDGLVIVSGSLYLVGEVMKKYSAGTIENTFT
ncbi:bifunctional folylpolyglutamate synthase/dihydrofolate synthase [Candidatus Latescibacterota bacterium]